MHIKVSHSKDYSRMTCIIKIKIAKFKRARHWIVVSEHMTEEKIDQNFRSRQLELGSWSWLLVQVITFFKQSFGFVFA